MVKQVRIIVIVGDGQHYVGRGQGDDEAGWHAVQGGGRIQCILGKKESLEEVSNVILEEMD